MLKQKEYNLADSNIANLGTDLEKKVKQAAAEKEPAWTGAGKAPGLLIWRIEKFHVVAWPKEKYGSFFSGDSYILLNTYKKKDSDALAWELHFWLGKFTTQDEAGTAAYKTVELDDHVATLGGHAVQHREVQGYESELFLGYFQSHITIMDGGIETGFKHAEPEKYVPRLLHFRGKKKVRLTQVPLARDSLNSTDVFVLDLGVKIYHWNGKKSTPFERSKAQQYCGSLEKERAGKAKTLVFDEGAKDVPDDFWKPLGGPGAIKETDPNPPVEEVKVEHKSFWKCADHSGKMDFVLVAKGKDVKKTMLDTKEVFILDTSAEVFAWIGKGAPVNEKKFALQYAQQYVKNNNRPPQLHIARVIQGGEGDHFLHHFH